MKTRDMVLIGALGFLAWRRKQDGRWIWEKASGDDAEKPRRGLRRGARRRLSQRGDDTVLPAFNFQTTPSVNIGSGSTDFDRSSIG